MTQTVDTDRADAGEAALNWLIVLQEEPDDADIRRRFELWLQGSAVNRQAWDEADRLWELLGEAGGTGPSARRPVVAEDVQAVVTPEGILHTATDGATGRPAKGTTQAKPRAAVLALAPQTATAHRWRRRIAAGLAVAAMAALVAVSLPGLLLRMAADHMTRTAEITSISLVDGSTVLLGASSAIAVDYGPEGRGIRLLRGQAWFDVARDAARPFTVSAGGMTVTVLGTSFDVNLTSDGALVGVAHGRVAIAGVETALGAGDWLWQGPDVTLETGTAPPDSIGNWRSGMLIVKNRPVAEVAAILGRYLPGGVTQLGSGIDGLRVTGLYDLRNPEASLEALRAAHDRTIPWLPGGTAIFY